MYKELLEDLLATEGTVFIDQNRNRLVQVNPAEKKRGLEYFKYFDSAGEHSAKRLARIEYRKPQYVYHSHNRGKDIWKLNGKEKEMLMDMMNSKNEENDRITNWQKSILQYNLEKGLSASETMQNLISSRNNLKHPGHLPFDLEMPDYRLLKGKKGIY